MKYVTVTPLQPPFTEPHREIEFHGWKTLAISVADYDRMCQLLGTPSEGLAIKPGSTITLCPVDDGRICFVSEDNE